MTTVTIEGVEREVRGLTPLELIQWESHIVEAAAAMHWVNLYAAVETLPARLQEVAFAETPPPKTVEKLAYFRAATTMQSVQFLTSMILDEAANVMVTEQNAAEIFWALRPFILDQPVVLSGAEGLAKLKGASDGGPA